MRTPSTLERRMLGVLAASALALSACGGDDATNATDASTASTTVRADVASMTLTFDGKTCTYEGETEFAPGPVELDLLNESQGPAAVNLVSIDEGHTIQDVIDDLGPEPATGHHPSWTQELGTWQPTPAGGTHHWEGDLDEGLYAMVCAQTTPLGV